MPSASACGMQSPFGRCANDLVPRLGSCSSRPTVGGLASASALTAASMSEKSQGGSSAPGLAWPQAAQVLSSGGLISVQAGQVQSPADRSAIGSCAGKAGAVAAASERAVRRSRLRLRATVRKGVAVRNKQAKT